MPRRVIWLYKLAIQDHISNIVMDFIVHAQWIPMRPTQASYADTTISHERTSAPGVLQRMSSCTHARTTNVIAFKAIYSSAMLACVCVALYHQCCTIREPARWGFFVCVCPCMLNITNCRRWDTGVHSRESWSVSLVENVNRTREWFHLFVSVCVDPCWCVGVCVRMRVVVRLNWVVRHLCCRCQRSLIRCACVCVRVFIQAFTKRWGG